ncbi:MAG: hypothetical protein IKA84_06395 [Clostridia bacterium]|nr:hypothetical protein [Clostridia bacterium]
MRKIFLSLLATILWLGCIAGGGYLAYQEFTKDQAMIMTDLNTIISADVPFYYWGETEVAPDEEENGTENGGENNTENGGENNTESGGEETE